MGESIVTINLTLEDDKHFRLPYQDATDVEEVCIAVCKHLKIGPVARHLFALRVSGTSIFLDPSTKLQSKNSNLDFRLRFKPFQVSRLRIVDPKAYHYYFQQVRLDIIESKVSDQIYEKHKSEVLGLTVTDMYRVMLEKNLSREVIEKDYKKFVPQKVLKMHRFFVKQPIHKSLEQLEIQTKTQKKSLDADYLITQYLTELETLAPEYLIETYKVLTMIEDNIATVIVKVLPPHCENSGIQYCLESKMMLKEWTLLCSIQDLGHISVLKDGEIEISHLNGNPFRLKFDSGDFMWSFISLVDGYYKLACKWTFNLCQAAPKLKKLNDLMCHGPVGGEFSYAKLERETNNKVGCFILRESETSYTTYYIDVCLKEGLKPSTFKLEQVKDDSFMFDDDLKLYKSVQEALQAYNSAESSIYLRECVPPSEDDVSPLLLCCRDDVRNVTLTGVAEVPQLAVDLRFSINQKDLQVFVGHKKEGFRKLTLVYKGMRKLTPSKKTEVALKFLQDNQKHHLKDFLNLIGQWRFLRSSTIARFYGMVISSKDVFIVMEYFKLGPLDQYLRDNKNVIKVVDLIEAASNLASALWYLKENGIVHGMIRCRKVMVHSHDDNALTVKLSDNGIFTGYDQSDVHWLPVECYNNLDKMSMAGDVWAWATTVYEIFTYGDPLPQIEYNQTVMHYLNGNRLPQPQSCPSPLYKLMLECWQADVRHRKQAQALNRDVNQFVRHKHVSNSDAETCQQELNATTCQNCQLPERMQDVSQYNFYSSALSAPNNQQIVNAFDLDPLHNLIVKDRIGQGFYGDVFKGIVSSNEDSVRVAVKKLHVFDGNLRELIAIKSLKHPNIVRVLAVLHQPDVQLVMEYAPRGSLQSYLRINQDGLGPKKLLQFATNVANGMEYLGSRNVVHRELAARNVLVTNDDHVKVTDFSMARLIKADLINSHNRNLPMKWFSPEVLTDGKFTTKSDVWAYGVTVWEIFSYGQEPPMLGHSDHMPEGHDQQVLTEALRDGIRYGQPNRCPQVVYASLMRPCWDEDPDIRPTFAQLALEAHNLMALV